MFSGLSLFLMGRVLSPWIGLFLLTVPVYGQADLNLKGAIDTRVHSSPDSVERRSTLMTWRGLPRRRVCEGWC
jgi:hypothetical protein